MEETSAFFGSCEELVGDPQVDIQKVYESRGGCKHSRKYVRR